MVGGQRGTPWVTATDATGVMAVYNTYQRLYNTYQRLL